MFRFTIRDVLWLTVVMAMGCAWWSDRRYEEARYRKLDAQVQDIRRNWAIEKYNADLYKSRVNGAYDTSEAWHKMANDLHAENRKLQRENRQDGGHRR